jgi:hypothetical protein
MVDGLTAGFGRLVVMDNPPPQDPPPAVVDHITATELNELSMAKREEALFDVHGIREGHESQETPEFLNDRLAQMEKALNHDIAPLDRQAYDMAMAQNAAYVQNPEFRLMFLRCDMFDPVRAAIRFARHFQAKLELFDSDLLCKDIAQDDLDEDGALKCLYSGWTQELPIRDISGRLVSVTFQQVLDEEMPVEEKVCCHVTFSRCQKNRCGDTHGNSQSSLSPPPPVTTATSGLLSTNEQCNRAGNAT